MFNKIATERLVEIARELALIGEEEPPSIFDQYPHFAKCLSVLMRVEIARRADDESD